MADNLEFLLGLGKKQANLSTGQHRCKVTAAHPDRSKSMTPGYKVTFEVTEGAAAGAKIEETYWLTERALGGFAVNQLDALGLGTADKLRAPQTIEGTFDVQIVIEGRQTSIESITRVS